MLRNHLSVGLSYGYVFIFFSTWHDDVFDDQAHATYASTLFW